MDITGADKMKIEFRIMLWYLNRHLKKKYKITLKEMDSDLESCGNPVIAEIWDIVKKGADEIKEDYQQKIIHDFTLALLWIIYRDTAYLPISMNFFKKILDKKEELYPYVMKYYVPLEDCYCNVWHDTKANTDKLKEEGKLPKIEGFMGYDEQQFVPSLVHQKHQKMIKNMKKETELKKLNKNYGREDEEDATTQTG